MFEIQKPLLKNPNMFCIEFRARSSYNRATSGPGTLRLDETQPGTPHRLSLVLPLRPGLRTRPTRRKVLRKLHDVQPRHANLRLAFQCRTNKTFVFGGQ